MNKTAKGFFLTLSLSSTLFGAEALVSGFATIGGAVSDKAYNYQRFINENGTIKSDSVVGAQLDLKFNEEWSLALQGKAAQSTKNDAGAEATLSWAFLSYRPSDNWLVRVGKLRVPIYVNSENMDVGTTYDAARLPVEMYSLSPASDFKGASVEKTWPIDNGDISLNLYYGKADFDWRTFARDDMSLYGGLRKGANFKSLEMESRGAVLTYESDFGDKYRVGVHRADGKINDGSYIIGDYSLQKVYAMGFDTGMLAYMPSQDAIIKKNETIVFTVGADIKFDDDIRVVAEYGTYNTKKTTTAPNIRGGYALVSKKINAFTPYVLGAVLKSAQKTRELYQNADGATQNPLTASSNRQVADSVKAFDQKSLSIGCSYALSQKEKIKAEWTQTFIGDMSAFIDPIGSASVKKEKINIYSLSYNIAF